MSAVICAFVFVACFGAACVEGTRALRHQAPGHDAVSDMVNGRRGARGLLYMDLGRRDEFTPIGWRHRKRRNTWMVGAVVALLGVWLSAG